MNTDVTVFKKITVNQIQEHTKKMAMKLKMAQQ